MLSADFFLPARKALIVSVTASIPYELYSYIKTDFNYLSRDKGRKFNGVLNYLLKINGSSIYVEQALKQLHANGTYARI